MSIKVKGLEVYEGDQGDRPFHILAHGTVTIGNMTIQGVALTWSPEEGALALAPAARCSTGAHAIRWGSREPFFKEMADQMLALYTAMGGKLPVIKRQYVPFVELGLPEDASREDVVAVLDRLSEERGVTCFTGRYELPPVVRAADRRAEVPCFLSEEDDTAGLRRTLRAEDEACERAGL